MCRWCLPPSSVTVCFFVLFSHPCSSVPSNFSFCRSRCSPSSLSLPLFIRPKSFSKLSLSLFSSLMMSVLLRGFTFSFATMQLAERSKTRSSMKMIYAYACMREFYFLASKTKALCAMDNQHAHK
ncbi:hypothetical protein EDD21DRAFT_54949 [Dissophora ornata]|nr:hypothetical protein EDD21DRAFT_54949 [Dissophora ornata]